MPAHPKPDHVALPFGVHRRALLACALGVAAWPAAPAPALAAMQGIPLALDAPDGLQPAGYLVSEKYDGVRALWDGHQLRFRSGLSVAAPAAFLQRLPSVPLDGELWLARGQFEQLSGLVRRRAADAVAWQPVRYMVFDLPGGAGGFAARHAQLQAVVRRQGWAALEAVAQAALPDRAALLQRLQAVLQAGGEGLMLRHADADYAGGRSAAMWKLKPWQDAEAVVLAHLPGQGRHAGRLGALQVRADNGQVFHIGTGFSDAQRTAPPALGQRITFAYRGFTEAGIPRFASFVRVRPAGL